MNKNTLFLFFIVLGSSFGVMNAKNQGSLRVESNAGQLNYFVSDETRSLLKEVDCPTCSFKTFGKYPYMVSYEPGKNEVKTVLCGRYSPNADDIELITKPWQIKAMKPLRVLTMLCDSNLKMDEKMRRETSLGRLVEDLLQTIQVLSPREYKGTVLFDEFMNGMPMKWVLRNAEDFRGLKAYILNNLEASDKAPVRKPLLLLEFDKVGTTLNAEDVSFLNTYFELANPTDSDVVQFFSKRQAEMTRAMRFFGGAMKVGDKFGDMVINALEKPTEGFKVELIAMMLATSLGAIAYPAITNLFTAPVNAAAKNAVKSATTGIKPEVIWTVAGITAAIIATYIASGYFIKPDVDVDLDEDADKENTEEQAEALEASIKKAQTA